MDGARLNMSHGNHDDHARRARLVREAETASGRPIALIADLQGPKLRVGDLPEPVILKRGDTVVIAGEDAARDGDLPVSPAVLGSVLQVGNDVLIDDGHVKLRVESVERGRARCEVVVGGVVSSHKGVNLPGVPLPIPSLTRKDLDDLEFALELGVDFVALSFVRSASDVRALRTLIEARGSQAHVIAKIEKAEAIARSTRSSPSRTRSWSRAAISASRSAPPTSRCCRSGSSRGARARQARSSPPPRCSNR